MPGPLSPLRGYTAEPSRSPPPTLPPTTPTTPRDAAVGTVVAKGAATLVEKRRMVVEGTTYRHDCSGMVAAAYASAGRTLQGGSRDLHAAAERAGLLHTRPRPHPGDIAFFDNTYDRDRDGRRDDMLTHVGVVESVDAHGTITIVHLGGSGVRRLKMSVLRPDDQAVNSQLRATNGRDGGPVLAGELWRDFGSLWRLEP
ncbi:MAG: cell wall-associated NlpC family hydrolase [Myxococcota bacterium]|jgi:cell wall-associated NlpC family hydrolase